MLNKNITDRCRVCGARVEEVFTIMNDGEYGDGRDIDLCRDCLDEREEF